MQTECTLVVRGLKVCMHCPVDTSQKRIVLSSDPEMAHRPSQLRHTQDILTVCPSNFRTHLPSNTSSQTDRVILASSQCPALVHAQTDFRVPSAITFKGAYASASCYVPQEKSPVDALRQRQARVRTDANGSNPGRVAYPRSHTSAPSPVPMIELNYNPRQTTPSARPCSDRRTGLLCPL